MPVGNVVIEEYLQRENQEHINGHQGEVEILSPYRPILFLVSLYPMGDISENNYKGIIWVGGGPRLQYDFCILMMKIY